MGTVPWNTFVIPAHAGIHVPRPKWIPAFAGMTSFKMASSWVSLDIHTMTRHAR
ncbi:hypothetical protein BH11GEM2_BH11GEM2_28890 [soil metagenome]